ncbi:MAG TPA: GspH/FimT family pseudopilin [Phenylobacterium sp.]|jgi:general secretion pathway protein H|nr:GspH/FimT family pseudopilin [Phenylobacterium sp.]
MSATGSRPDAGATLIEMLVVVGILGLVAVLVFPAWISPLQRVQLYEARAALVSHLRTARADSIRQGAQVTLELTDGGRGYGWEQRRTALPAGVVVDGEPRAITFFADGSSSGGELKVISRGRSLLVEVDSASGLTEAPPG